MAATSAPPGGVPPTAAESSDELLDSERSRSRTRPKRRRRGVGGDTSLNNMRDMQDALRSVIQEMNLATKSDLAELDIRIQKVEEEVGRLPDLVAAEVSKKLKDKGWAEQSAGQQSRVAWVPSSMMVRGWAVFQDPASQATSADELQKKLPRDILEHPSMVRPAVANHQLLLRFRGACRTGRRMRWRRFGSCATPWTRRPLS